MQRDLLLNFPTRSVTRANDTKVLIRAVPADDRFSKKRYHLGIYVTGRLLKLQLTGRLRLMVKRGARCGVYIHPHPFVRDRQRVVALDGGTAESIGLWLVRPERVSAHPASCK